MKYSGYIIVFILFFQGFSCTNKEEVDETKKPAIVVKEQLINWRVFNKKGFNNMSFPVWFSPALIDSNNIESLTLSYSNFNFTDSSLNVADTLPNRKMEIQFDRKGYVSNVKLDEFLTGIHLGYHSFTYPHSTDSLGYCAPVISSQMNFGKKGVFSMFSTIKELQQFNRLVQVSRDSSVITYEDKNNQDIKHHYFIIDSSKWDVSFIDNRYDPVGKDIFYYGDPAHYKAAFKLQNLVEKTKLEKVFINSIGLLKQQNFYKNDFVTKRYYEYSQNGYCVGYSDSLMTDSYDFIHTEQAVVHYLNNIPNKIEFYNAEDTLKMHPIRRIKISYKKMIK
jgi:hypothetical protein